MNQKRPALGRGLSDLLSQASQTGHADGAAGATGAQPREIPTAMLHPNRHQPRSVFSDAAMEGLAASLRQHGMVQPIVARRLGERYEIVAGERRWRAAKKIGLHSVPVIVKEIPDDRLLEFALVENIQRQELNPIEEARAYFQLGEHLRLTQEQVADRVGKSRPQVANTLRLLRLPADVQDMVADGRLSAGHAKVLLGAEEPGLQRQLAEEVAERQMSVRTLEDLLHRLSGPAGKGAAAGKKRRAPQAVFLKAAQEELTLAWATRIEIRPKGKGGSIVFHFSSEAELDRLFEGLKPGPG